MDFLLKKKVRTSHRTSLSPLPGTRRRMSCFLTPVICHPGESRVFLVVFSFSAEKSLYVGRSVKRFLINTPPPLLSEEDCLFRSAPSPFYVVLGRSLFDFNGHPSSCAPVSKTKVALFISHVFSFSRGWFPPRRLFFSFEAVFLFYFLFPPSTRCVAFSFILFERAPFAPAFIFPSDSLRVLFL